MRGFSSVASIAAHCGLAAALLFGTAETVHPNPIRVVPIAVLPSQPRRVIEDPGTWAPPSPADLSIQVDRIPLLKLEIGGSATQVTFAPVSASVPSSPRSASIVGWVDLGSENGPQVLSGPLPSYPELLRQAGVEGRVVLEAIVEATGRVRRDSIVVVSATDPGFVAPARQALLATLFRPAFVAGRAVRTRIRIPFEFTIQNGLRHPR